AFVMGMLLSGSRYRLQVEATLEPYKGVLMSLFFVAVGMSIDVRALSDAPLLFAQHTAVLILLKLGILLGLVLAFGYSRDVALRVACYLAQGGEFGFVLFGSAQVLGVIDQTTFIQAVGVISVTMLLTPILVRAGDALSRLLETRGGEQPERYAPGVPESPHKLVVIGGYGRVGHTVATLLHASGVPLVVFDTDAGRVAHGRKDGLQVYYGDVGDPALLLSAGVANASLVVLTIDKAASARRAVAHIRTSFPGVPIIARARDLATVTRLLAAGATDAVPDVIESSLCLASLALQLVSVPQLEVEMLVQGARERNYKLVSSE
ncbi:MAG: NAD-binding protein, partial [Pseudomonadota bacterium]|nr:NAD-binding protein [Pseudomonadota bacterium]